METFLSFKVSDINFVLSVNNVIEIVEVPKITRILKSPDFLLGVSNLRNKAIPILDTSKKLCEKESITSKESRVLVINYENQDFGLLVDSVLEVFDFDKDEIKKTKNGNLLENNGEYFFIMDLNKVL